MTLTREAEQEMTMTLTREADPGRSRKDRILDKLGQRETLLELAGAIGYFITLGLHAAEVFDPQQWEHLAIAYSTALGLLGTGATAQVKRGAQRAQEVASAVAPALTAVREQAETSRRVLGQVTSIQAEVAAHNQRAAERDAEPGHHFVENQQRSMFVAK